MLRDAFAEFRSTLYMLMQSGPFFCFFLSFLGVDTRVCFAWFRRSILQVRDARCLFFCNPSCCSIFVFPTRKHPALQCCQGVLSLLA